MQALRFNFRHLAFPEVWGYLYYSRPLLPPLNFSLFTIYYISGKVLKTVGGCDVV